MKTRLLLKIATSSLALGATLVGCQTTGRSPIASASAPDPAKIAETAAGSAQDARAALAAGLPTRAIARAEAAVAASPQDAGYRALLAKAYLAGGRFASAETAFGEALTLDPADGQARLSLALVQTALGRHDTARETLALVPATAPIADVGLAYALAGDRQRGLDMLTTAARADDATAKTRQNLALAYALMGRWVEARSTAAMDIPADQLGDRMGSWAQFTQPLTNYDQVATLLGVKPVVDEGRPARLALILPAAGEAPVALAATDQAPVSATLAAVEPSAAPAALADATPVSDHTPIETVAFDAPAEPMTMPLVMSTAADPSPFVKAPDRPARLVMAAANSAAEAAPAPAPMPTPQASGAGRWVVQLGAFSDAQRVEIAWERALGRMRTLGGFSPSSTTYVSTRRAATYYRLSIAGFGAKREADALCEQVKSVGGACFVRGEAGDAPVRWVSRKAAPVA